MRSLFLGLSLILLATACTSGARNQPFTNIYPGNLSEILDKPDLVIIDVRTPSEWKGGTVDVALLLNLHDRDFPDHIRQLSRDNPYLIYCNTGNRSQVVSRFMVREGFTRVFNYAGTHQQIRGEHHRLTR